LTSINLGVIFFVIFSESRKYLTVNDLRAPARPNLLMFNEL